MLDDAAFGEEEEELEGAPVAAAADLPDRDDAVADGVRDVAPAEFARLPDDGIVSAIVSTPTGAASATVVTLGVAASSCVFPARPFADAGVVEAFAALPGPVAVEAEADGVAFGNGVGSGATAVVVVA